MYVRSHWSGHPARMQTGSSSFLKSHRFPARIRTSETPLMGGMNPRSQPQSHHLPARPDLSTRRAFSPPHDLTNNTRSPVAGDGRPDCSRAHKEFPEQFPRGAELDSCALQTAVPTINQPTSHLPCGRLHWANSSKPSMKLGICIAPHRISPQEARRE